MDSFLSIAHSFAKVLPVPFAARTALVGVIGIAIAGGFHEHRNSLQNLSTDQKLEKLLEEQVAAKDELKLYREDLSKRLDRMETKVDKLLLERKR